MRTYIILFEATGAWLVCALKRFHGSFSYEFRDEFRLRNTLLGLLVWFFGNLVGYWLLV